MTGGGQRRLDGHFDREIVRLALPAFGALVAEPLYILADTAIVGHLGRDPLAGLGIAAAILTFAFAICNFLAYKTTAAVARSRGAGDPRAAAEHGIAGLWLAAGIGAVVTVLLLVTSGPLTDAIADTAAVAHNALVYVRISAFGAVPFMLTLACTGYLRGTEDTATPLVIAVAANVVNIALELLLIRVAHWDIAGSALGTVIAQYLAAGAALWVVYRRCRALNADLHLHWPAVRRTARVGAHLFVRTASLLTAFFVASLLASRLGTVEIAAHNVTHQLWLFLAFALDAIAIAGQVIVGRTLGAGDDRATRRATRRMLQWGIGVGIGFAALVVVCMPWIPRWFTSDVAVQGQIRELLWLVAIMQPLGAVVFVLDGVLIGAGDARYLSRAMAAAAAVFIATAISLVAVSDDLRAVWIALIVLLAARAYGMVHRYRGRAWLVLGDPEGVGRR